MPSPIDRAAPSSVIATPPAEPPVAGKKTQTPKQVSPQVADQRFGALGSRKSANSAGATGGDPATSGSNRTKPRGRTSSPFSPINLVKGAAIAATALATTSFAKAGGAAGTHGDNAALAHPGASNDGTNGAPTGFALGTVPVVDCAPAPDFWATAALGTNAAAEATPATDAAATPSLSDEEAWDKRPFCESTFVEVYKAAQQMHAAGKPVLPYLLDDATNGIARPDGGRRFGVEVEFDFEKSVGREEGLRMLADIAQDLHAHNLTKSPFLKGHGDASKEGYTTDGNGGMLEAEPMPPPGYAQLGEWVSPISADEPEQWSRAKLALDIVKQRPTTVSHRTAAHFHISNDDYPDQLEPFTNLLSLLAKYEDVFFRLGGRPDLKPSSLPTQQKLGRSVYMQAFSSTVNHGPQLRPVGYRKPNRMPEGGYDSVAALLKDQNKKHMAINLKGVKQGPNDHLEVRIPDSSLDPAVLQAHLSLYLHLVEKSVQAARGNVELNVTGAEPIGSHYSPAGEAVPGDPHFMAETASFRDMLDQLFDRNIDKARMTALFAITGWQPPAETDGVAARALGWVGWNASRAVDAARTSTTAHWVALAAAMGVLLNEPVRRLVVRPR